jgi:hypothetical protein
MSSESCCRIRCSSRFNNADLQKIRWTSIRISEQTLRMLFRVAEAGWFGAAVDAMCKQASKRSRMVQF